LDFRSKSHKSKAADASAIGYCNDPSKTTDRAFSWRLSLGLHLVLAATAGLLVLGRRTGSSRQVDITVIESPRVSSAAVEIHKPPPKEKTIPRKEVFGQSRKALTAPDGIAVKAGNTIAKAPDNKVLKASDPDSLPIPTEDYLVTQMPKLQSDVRVPYPPEAKQKGIQGAVLMDLLIDNSGKVRDVTLVEGPSPDLSAAAVAAARNFSFSPAQIQDKPVAVRIRYAYRFVLEQ
jgi:protein TonB